MARTSAIRGTAAVVFAVLSLGLAACQSGGRLGTWDEEAARVTSLAGLPRDATVADVGAGEGGLALSLAERLGPGAKLYATEVDPRLVEGIRAAVAERRLANVTVIEGAENGTRLPDACCDAIVLRTVYHHLTQPKPMGTSLARALKPGGRLVVIDFPPNAEVEAAEGTAGGREGHGVTSAIVVSELKEASLEFVRIVRDWNGEGFYAVLMQKPR